MTYLISAVIRIQSYIYIYADDTKLYTHILAVKINQYKLQNYTYH